MSALFQEFVEIDRRALSPAKENPPAEAAGSNEVRQNFVADR
jgi:hypothetical protein